MSAVHDLVIDDATDRTRLFQLTSWLLGYPDDALLRAQGELAIMAACLENRTAQALVHEFLTWFAETGTEQVQQHYADTFDVARPAGRYLTAHLHGDTHERDGSVQTLRRRYHLRGLQLVDDVAPDLLAVALEFAARPADSSARRHRRGVELLRDALTVSASPYRHLLEAISVVLPPLDDADRAVLEAVTATRTDQRGAIDRDDREHDLRITDQKRRAELAFDHVPPDRVRSLFVSRVADGM